MNVYKANAASVIGTLLGYQGPLLRIGDWLAEPDVLIPIVM